jgi:hypothetical protein
MLILYAGWEGYIHLINDTGVWPHGCLVASYYGPLNPDQIYSADNQNISTPPSIHLPLDRVGGSINTDGAQGRELLH